ncbi:MAG: hypothetical protein LBU15_04515 [Rickettsiales bacterium]|nr:hypothetical protein [Rickettsiales bacterium]
MSISNNKLSKQGVLTLFVSVVFCFTVSAGEAGATVSAKQGGCEWSFNAKSAATCAASPEIGGTVAPGVKPESEKKGVVGENLEEEKRAAEEEEMVEESKITEETMIAKEKEEEKEEERAAEERGVIGLMARAWEFLISVSKITEETMIAKEKEEEKEKEKERAAKGRGVIGLMARAWEFLISVLKQPTTDEVGFRANSGPDENKHLLMPRRDSEGFLELGEDYTYNISSESTKDYGNVRYYRTPYGSTLLEFSNGDSFRGGSGIESKGTYAFKNGTEVERVFLVDILEKIEERERVKEKKEEDLSKLEKVLNVKLSKIGGDNAFYRFILSNGYSLVLDRNPDRINTTYAQLKDAAENTLLITGLLDGSYETGIQFGERFSDEMEKIGVQNPVELLKGIYGSQRFMCIGNMCLNLPIAKDDLLLYIGNYRTKVNGDTLNVEIKLGAEGDRVHILYNGNVEVLKNGDGECPFGRHEIEKTVFLGNGLVLEEEFETEHGTEFDNGDNGYSMELSKAFKPKK